MLNSYFPRQHLHFQGVKNFMLDYISGNLLIIDFSRRILDGAAHALGLHISCTPAWKSNHMLLHLKLNDLNYFSNSLSKFAISRQTLCQVCSRSILSQHSKNLNSRWEAVFIKSCENRTTKPCEYFEKKNEFIILMIKSRQIIIKHATFLTGLGFKPWLSFRDAGASPRQRKKERSPYQEAQRRSFGKFDSNLEQIYWFFIM